MDVLISEHYIQGETTPIEFLVKNAQDAEFLQREIDALPNTVVVGYRKPGTGTSSPPGLASLVVTKDISGRPEVRPAYCSIDDLELGKGVTRKPIVSHVSERLEFNGRSYTTYFNQTLW